MTDVFGEGRRFEAHVPERIGDSVIRIDGGPNLANAIAGFSVHGFNDRREVEIHLHMEITETLSIGGHNATVVVSPHSTELLTGAGWIPPDAAAAMLGIVETARGWRRGDGTAFTAELVEQVDLYEKGMGT